MEEKILIEGLCNRIKGVFVQNGHGMLTNERFIYSKHSLGKMAVMGVLVNLTKGNYEFDIPIRKIERVEETKRLFDKIIIIHTKQGEEYRFFVTKIEEWKIHFNNLLNGKASEDSLNSSSSSSSADEIMKYKQLLDAGAITQDEYVAKKKQLLGL